MQKLVWAITRKIYDSLGPVKSWKLAMSPPVAFALQIIAKIAGDRTIPFTTKYGLTFKLRLSDILFGGFLHLGESNPLEMHVLRRILRPNDVVIDAGANVGWYALNAAQVVGSGGQVCAFEPNPAVADWASENCRLNHLTNVRIEKIALADKVGRLEFYIGDNFGSLVQRVARLASRNMKRMNVSVTTIDAYAKRVHIKKIRLIKVDVEGKDLEVLQGARQTLRRHHPYLIVEVFGLSWDTDAGRDKKILAYLKKLGYHAYAFVQGGLQSYNPRSGQPQIINLFFASDTDELTQLHLLT
jgi:FkbM family methyltransferase